MDCSYKDVTSFEKREKVSWKPFLRQLFVSSGAWLVYFLCGLSFGVPTVMIPQLRADNSTAAVSDEMASWLSSVFGYSALPWVVIICLVTKRFGRKLPFGIVCLNTFCYYALLYFSANTTHILISEIMQGMSHASNMTLSVIIVSEYSSPKYRGIFLAIKSATIFWGIWVANAIGTFFYWKYIPLLGLVLSLYTVSVAFWPESPQWLASRGRFNECRTVYRWLRGTDEKSEKELEKLIKSQIELKKCEKESFSVKGIVETVSSKAFYKPLLLSIVMILQYQFSGKIVCAVYAIDIIKKITDSETTAYIGMLTLDGVTVAGMYMGCFLSRILKRRTLLFSSSAVGITFLYIMSFYLFLIDLGVVVESKIATVTFLTFFAVSISCGIMILSTSIYAELIPLRYKSSCTMISALIFVSLTSTLLKMFPFISRNFNMSGAFLFYAVTSMICAIVSFIYLPETKDKTLQEIEDIFDEKRKFEEGRELISGTSDHSRLRTGGHL